MLWFASCAAIIAVGCAWGAALLSTLRPEVFFSGDGGLKALMTRQLLDGHFVAWLDLDQPAWVRSLWDQGMYPFRPPFAHPLHGHWYPSFEWTFPTLSAPGYALFGWRGLLVIPVLSILTIWARLVWLFRELRIAWLPASLALALVVFASPLTFYGAIFWEHAPAVAFALLGYADLALLETKPSRVRAARAGLLLGAAVFLRPEALVFGAFATAAHLRRKDWQKPALAVATFGLMLGLYLLVNQWLYGDVRGVHSIQVLEETRTLTERFDEAIERGRLLRVRWFHYVTFTWASLVLAGVALPARGTLGVASRRASVVAALTFVGIVAIVPNDGGLQIGPRYLLALIPLLALITAVGLHLLRRTAPLACGALVVASLALAGITLYDIHGVEYDRLRDNYQTRIAPCVEAMAQQPAGGIVFNHHWAAMEMSSVIDGQPVVTAMSPFLVDRAVVEMIRHHLDVLLVEGPGRDRFRVEPRQRLGDIEVEWTPVSSCRNYRVLRGVRARPITRATE